MTISARVRAFSFLVAIALVAAAAGAASAFVLADPTADRDAIGSRSSIAAVDFARKGASEATPAEKYAALGCPGDCSATPGDQRCTDMSDYQQSELGRIFNEEDYLTGAMRGYAVSVDPTDTAGCHPPMTADPKEHAKQQKAFAKCIGTVVKAVTRYRDGLLQCQRACQADYSGKKGGGGPVDDPPSCRLAAISDPAEPFAACVAKVAATSLKKPVPARIASFLPFVRTLLDDASSDLFDEPDGCSAS